VIGWGTATFIEDPAEKSAALAALNHKFGAKEGPFPEAMLARVAVVRIDIDRMTGKANRAR
jgi:nitroimidazol reductase NimA-like FMN-containing flavoprotein (pyridoxamine 5'-phosphate oxidase superfamily)